MIFIIYAGIIAILVILDQISKFATVKYLKPIGSVEVLPKILNFTYAENTGAAFSMLEDKIWFFVIVTLLALGVMFYTYKKEYIKHKIGIFSLVLVAGGAIGNLIDRVMYGFVVDMFEFAFVRFAIFNVADICITFGGVLLCYYILFLYDKDNPKEENNAENRD
ncbi:MAG: signal peptidase II [Clostridia bacterium]